MDNATTPIVTVHATEPATAETECNVPAIDRETLIRAANETAKKSGCDVHIPTGMKLAGYGVLKSYPDTRSYLRVFGDLSDALSNMESRGEDCTRYLFALPGVELTHDGNWHADTLTADGIALADASDVVRGMGTGPADMCTLIESVAKRVIRQHDRFDDTETEDGYRLACVLTENMYDGTPASYGVRYTCSVVPDHGMTLTDYAYHFIRVAGTTERKASHIDVTDDGKLSFLPAGRRQSASDAGHNPYTSSYRQAAKMSKVLRMILVNPETFTDAEYEAFGNAIRAYVARGEDEFRIITGDDILDAYDEACYAPDESTGTLENSCMRYEYCRSYLYLYSANPDRVSLLTLWNADGYLLGRALLWHTDDGDVVIDRVYGSDVTQERIKAYARGNGWDRVGYSHFVSVRNAEHDEYPYMDTLMYLNMNGDGSGTLCADNGYTHDAEYRILRETDGSYETRNGECYCGNCGLAFMPDDSEDSSYCPSCIYERTCMDCGRYVGYGWYADELTEGYCERCVSDHTCVDCGDVYDDLDNGFCDACADNHRCTVCHSPAEDRNDAGTCTSCVDRLCVRCGVLRDWHEMSTTYRNMPERHNECLTCQSQPTLFPMPHPTRNSTSSGNCFAWNVASRPDWQSAYHCEVPATGYRSIADDVSVSDDGMNGNGYPAFVALSQHYGYGTVAYRPLCEMPER